MESIQSLKQKTQAHKRRPHTFFLAFGYTFHRDISIYITWMFVTLWPHIKPNYISFGMIIVGIVGIGLLSQSVFHWQLWGLGLIYISFLLDKVDGEVARYTQSFSVTGMYLDEVYHSVITVGTIAAMFYPLFFTGDPIQVILLVLLLVLSVYRRFERKSYILISPKVVAQFSNHELTVNKNHFWQRIGNSFVLKCTAVVERFDILLFSILCVLTASNYTQLPWYEYFFWGYATIVSLYAIRRFMLSCSGSLSADVATFLNRDS